MKRASPVTSAGSSERTIEWPSTVRDTPALYRRLRTCADGPGTVTLVTVDDERWADVLAQARDVLAAVAAARSTISYDALHARIGWDVPDRGDRDLASVLRTVAIDADDNGEGLLSAVVVRPSGLPGSGWFRLARQRGRDTGDRRRAWRAELERVWDAFSSADGGDVSL